MKKKMMQIVAMALAAVLIVPQTGALAVLSTDNAVVKVGLAYGSTALPSANLENSVGSGYRFGYYDENRMFQQVGYTTETKLSILKAQDMYLAGGAYSDTPKAGSQTIGCYHIQLPQSYPSFERASADASAISGAFPAWVSGNYYVRVGAYSTSEEAQAASAMLGLSGTVTGSSGSAVSVVATGTTELLFQFDGDEAAFGILPGTDDAVQTATWFKGYRYYGGFEYLRSGGNLTVINMVHMEDYVKGVISAEMGGAWPLEALKALAVCVRSYTTQLAGKHTNIGFDVCNTTCCQVYYGLNKATDTSNQAAESTYGEYAWYNGSPIEGYYFSSDGGATEDVGNVWRDDVSLPYLKGVADPYEATIADRIPNYNWTVTFTRQQLTERLNGKGYLNSGIVDLRVTATTPMGNVKSITFTDSAGKSWTMSKEAARTTLGLRSLRYTINGSGGAIDGSGSAAGGNDVSGPYFVNDGGGTLESLDGIYAIDGNGGLNTMNGTPYVISGDGTAQLSNSGTGKPAAAPVPTVGSTGGNTFVITGKGYGHNVGMSQYGANAMAKAGYTYDQILKFYFTGIDVR